MSQQGFDDSVRKYADIDPLNGDPQTVLGEIIAACSGAEDDDDLCWIGILCLEPLLDLHWREVADAAEAELRRNGRLRKALSCSAPAEVPDELSDRLRSLIRPDEDVGHRHDRPAE